MFQEYADSFEADHGFVPKYLVQACIVSVVRRCYGSSMSKCLSPFGGGETGEELRVLPVVQRTEPATVVGRALAGGFAPMYSMEAWCSLARSLSVMRAFACP